MKKHWPLLALFILITAFFSPFWLKGLLPIPADTIVGLYHPFRDTLVDKFPNGVPFKNFLLTDPVRQLYLWKQLAIQQLKLAHLPWWNPYAFSGAPLLANFQAGVFYPLNLIFLLPKFVDSWTIYIISQPFLAGLFFYWYAVYKKLHPLAAAFGALSFVFGGFFVVWLEWGNIGHTVLWLPLLLLSIDKIIATNKRRWQLIFLFALVSQFFAGHLQIAFYVSTLTLAYTIAKLTSLKRAQKKHFFKLFTIVYLLFAIVTAIQWLPTFQFINLSARGLDQANLLTRPDWFIPLRHLAQSLAPDFFGNPATLNYWGVWNYSEFVSYIGLIPLIFALAVFSFRRPLLRFFSFTILVSLLFALPSFLAKLPFLLNLPLISQAQPSRLLSLITFSLSVLAAFGFNSFLKQRLKLKLPLIMIGLGLLLLWLVTFRFIPQEFIIIARRNLILPTVILFGLLIALFISKFKPLFLVACYLLLLISSVDLLRFAAKFTPFSSPEYLFPQTKTLSYLQSDQDIFRIMSLDQRLLPPNFSLAYNIQTIAGYDPLYLKSYARLITQLETDSASTPILSFNRIITPTNINSELVDLLSVKYVLSLNPLNNPKLKLVLTEGRTYLYQNLKVLPRARLTQGEGLVTITDYQPNQVTIRVDLNTAGILELADMMYPGWQAKIDGRSRKIAVSGLGFRQVPVPQGTHQIIFYYQCLYHC